MEINYCWGVHYTLYMIIIHGMLLIFEFRRAKGQLILEAT